MPNQNDSATNSPFEIVTSKKSGKGGKKGLVIAIVIVVFLILSVVAGVLLVRQQQNVQERAAANLCPSAEACPVVGQPGLLLSCNPSNADGTPQSFSCASTLAMVGQIKACGPSQYCCPSIGASWTTDLTLCSTPSPTPTIMPTASGSALLNATASATPTASASAKPLVQTSPLPIPVTGTDWPTVVGAGVGAAAIIGAILLVI
ncbi:MAG: hypothetical protein ABSE04_03955 [Candidatus Microgenomates bacterium]|jgi:hypothetical protein